MGNWQQANGKWPTGNPQSGRLLGLRRIRDPQRTPMQWDETNNSGFTKGKPWLRLSDQYQTQNVQLYSKDGDSILMFYKRLITLRQNEISLVLGKYTTVLSNDKIFTYTRKVDGHDGFLIVLNFTNKAVEFKSANFSFEGTIVLGTSKNFENISVKDQVRLEPNAGMIVKLGKN